MLTQCFHMLSCCHAGFDRIRVADFGHGRIFRSNEGSMTLQGGTMNRGTPGYSAPETISSRDTVSFAFICINDVPIGPCSTTIVFLIDYCVECRLHCNAWSEHNQGQPVCCSGLEPTQSKWTCGLWGLYCTCVPVGDPLLELTATRTQRKGDM